MKNNEKQLWEKHFGNTPSVPLSKAENYFNDLAKICRAENNQAGRANVCTECDREMDEMEHNYGTEDMLVCIQCYQTAQGNL